MADKKQQQKVKRIKALIKGVILEWNASTPTDKNIVDTRIAHKNKILGIQTLKMIREDDRIIFNIPHKWRIMLQAHFKNKSVTEYEIVPANECTFDQIDQQCVEIATGIAAEDGFDYFRYIVEAK